MEAIRGSSNLAQPVHMISHRDVNQKWLSIWRGGERHCQLVTTWLVCTGQEWSLFEYGSCRDRISPELSYQSVPWLITGIASELLGIREGGSFSKPQNENYDLVHPLWWCGYIHKHLFSLTLAGMQHLLLGGCVCENFLSNMKLGNWQKGKLVYTAYELITHLKIKHPTFPH